VHENTGEVDKISSQKHGFYTKMHQLRGNRQESKGLFGQKCNNRAIIGDEAAPIFGAEPDLGGGQAFPIGVFPGWMRVICGKAFL
jgi:hypothetical protein